MRSHILWMEKRKCRKAKVNKEDSKDLINLRGGAFIVAPCPHDGRFPLEKSGKYCHFVQRLQRTTSQRAYKGSKGDPLRGFEDEKFSFVAFRRGQRPRESWPLDGMKFETLKEQRAKRNLEDLEIDYEDLIVTEETADIIPYEEVDPSAYDSDEDQEEETGNADLGGSWGRIIFPPVLRGRQVHMNICRPTNQDASEGSFDREVITQSKNPTLHHQARKSFWGDLWPLGRNVTSSVS